VNEVLVYDENNHKAHCLNETSALVWKSCDGRTSVPKMARLLEKKTRVAVPEETVWLAIRQLEASRLLDLPATQQGWIPQVSRRAVMRTIGVAVVALPLITSITNPTAAAAASCVALGQPCSGGPGQGNCCAGLFCNPPNTVCGSSGP
jgi:alpha-D-ribose 1-methylphosphonate 5-triphosphate synthase subunit PhnL